MSPLDTFLSRLDEYATNTVSALGGKMQFTTLERDDLKRLFDALPEKDRRHALDVATDRNLDVTGWMNPLDVFLFKLTEYGRNDTAALEGKIQFTLNEREDLKLLFANLSEVERPKALAAAQAQQLDTSSW